MACDCGGDWINSACYPVRLGEVTGSWTPRNQLLATHTVCRTVLHCPGEALPFRVGRQIWPRGTHRPLLDQQHSATTAYSCCLSWCLLTISWNTIHHETSPVSDVKFTFSIFVSGGTSSLKLAEKHTRVHFLLRKHTHQNHVQTSGYLYAAVPLCFRNDSSMIVIIWWCQLLALEKVVV